MIGRLWRWWCRRRVGSLQRRLARIGVEHDALIRSYEEGDLLPVVVSVRVDSLRIEHARIRGRIALHTQRLARSLGAIDV